MNQLSTSSFIFIWFVRKYANAIKLNVFIFFSNLNAKYIDSFDLLNLFASNQYLINYFSS